MPLLRSIIVCWLSLSVTVFADDLPRELTSFHPRKDSSEFRGVPGEWDAAIRERGWVLQEAGRWHLWYTGYDPMADPPLMRVGHATSADGLHWQRDSRNPLISDRWVEDMMVVRHDNRYYMFAEGFQDQAQLLESGDGVHWHSRGTLDVRLTSGDPIPPGPFGTPTAYVEDGVWYLFYERRDEGVWLARSTDMKLWTNVQDSPVLIPGPAEYDRLMIAMNQVIRIDNAYVAVLHGTGTESRPRQWCTYFATSRDLIHWQKSDVGPVQPVADNKSSGQLVPLGDHRWRLYTMHDHITVHETSSR